jgi:hypothetical protein
VTLAPDEAERAGIRTAIAERAESTNEIEAFGKVLDPLAFLEALHARDAAQAAATVARAEVERVTRLNREDQNASTRDLEAARAAVATTTAGLGDATARLMLAWGAAAETAATFADDLVAGRAALVRVDLPAGAIVAPPPTTVTVAAVGTPNHRVLARVIGRAPTIDPLLQGEAYLAVVTDDPPRPGTMLAVTLHGDGSPDVGVAVPAAAVVWVDALPAVYVERIAGSFERRPVTLGPRRGDRWIVTTGVAFGDPVAVAGAARLLSSEMIGAEPATD